MAGLFLTSYSAGVYDALIDISAESHLPSFLLLANNISIGIPSAKISEPDSSYHIIGKSEWLKQDISFVDEEDFQWKLLLQNKEWLYLVRIPTKDPPGFQKILNHNQLQLWPKNSIDIELTDFQIFAINFSARQILIL